MGYAKRNKRHAQESKMKKNIFWTHEGPSIKKEVEKRQPMSKERKMERDSS